MRKLLLAATALLLALSHAAHAFDAVITACHDGDTCTTSDGTRIRLHAVDAPELDQPFGNAARLRINAMIAGQHVDIRPTGDLSYGRTVADIYVGGRSVGAEMVSAGLAWNEPRWNTDPSLPTRQGAAQAAHLGLWADNAAVPPWQWRHEHGGGTRGYGYSYTPHYGRWFGPR
jgi:micrococcal nuclease